MTDDLTYDTGFEIGRLTAALERCRKAFVDLAKCVHDLLVLLDEADLSITADEPLSLAIERTDQLVHRARSAPGGAVTPPAPETITR